MASLVLAGDTSGSITVSAPAISGSNTQTLVATTGTLAPIVSGTAVTASSTSVDFTGIPSWVKRITILGSGVSTSGTSSLLARCGSGSFVAIGYQDTTSQFSASAVSSTNSTNTTGTTLTQGNAAAGIYNFKVVYELLGSNTYVITAICGRSDATNNNLSIGFITLSGALDRVRVTTVNGTDLFDAGSINILYE
jgi:hypothetical protein